MKNTQITAPFPFAIADATTQLLRTCGECLAALTMTISHPRSLARETATWRPPTIRMPARFGLSPIAVTITRRRVGDLARARIRGYGETRVPAYMVMVRLTASNGRTISFPEAEAWIRALLPQTGEFSYHRVDGLGAPTYCWLTDASFTPITSPASLFQPQKSAA